MACLKLAIVLLHLIDQIVTLLELLLNSLQFNRVCKGVFRTHYAF